MDILGDAREEIIVWNKNCVKIGQNMESFSGGIPSFRNDRQYRLRLSGARQLYRGELFFDYGSGSGSINTEPSVNAGTDQTITLPSGAALNGAVSDDGYPDPPGSYTTLWTEYNGPGHVTFDDEYDEDTNAYFSVPGTYVLRLTADDSELQAYDDVTITVNDGIPPAKPTALRIK